MTAVSVVIPVYNGENHILKCLENIAKQTLSDMEIMCVDDGSIDGTSAMIEKAQAIYNNIHLISQVNQGAGAARNTGIKSARGEYIAFIDSDDLYPDSKVLETLYNKAKQNGALICGGNRQMGSIENRIDLQFTQEGFTSYQNLQIDSGFQRFIFQRQFLIDNELRFPEKSVYEDPIFLVHAMHCAEEVYLVPTYTYTYTDSHHKTLNSNQTIDYLDGLIEIMGFAKNNEYELMYRRNYERLITSASYFAEINYPKAHREIFLRLITLNEALDGELLKASGVNIDEDYLIPALETVDRMAYKYTSILNSRIMQGFRKIRRLFK